MFLRRQDLVRASELCRRSILTTSVLVRSLQSSQWPGAHHSDDTVPATNWAWIIGHTDTVLYPLPPGSKGPYKVGSSTKLPLLLDGGWEGGERLCPHPGRREVLGTRTLARLQVGGRGDL